jgi:hypothetical protein
MFGDTITITLDGSGGVARVCNKINQDSYSAEYLNRISTDELRVKIRHQKESLKNGDTYPIERHNVLVTQVVFPTLTVPERFREVSFTIRNRPDDPVLGITDLGEGLTFFLTDTNLDKLYIWES